MQKIPRTEKNTDLYWLNKKALKSYKHGTGDIYMFLIIFPVL